MGDISNMYDIDRFLRSIEGQKRLEEIRQMLEGRTIVEVSFSNEIHTVATTLRLDNSTTFVVFEPSLELEVLREEFAEVIEREYYKDYPERRPGGRKKRRQ